MRLLVGAATTSDIESLVLIAARQSSLASVVD
jgi:hypothetical protein